MPEGASCANEVAMGTDPRHIATVIHLVARDSPLLTMDEFLDRAPSIAKITP